MTLKGRSFPRCDAELRYIVIRQITKTGAQSVTCVSTWELPVCAFSEAVGCQYYTMQQMSTCGGLVERCRQGKGRTQRKTCPIDTWFIINPT